MTESLFIHPTAKVASKQIGENSTVGPFCVITEGAKIGEHAFIGANCLIQDKVSIGQRVSIKGGVQLWDGVTIGDDVNIGPNVTFAFGDDINNNDKQEVYLEDGVSIGGGATLLAGITIGAGASVAAGAVVTSSVPAYTIVKGNPARVTGYVSGASANDEGVAISVNKLDSVPARGEQGTVSLGVGDSVVQRLKFVSDMRGNLSVSEFPQDIPFNPKRYFLVFDVPNQEVRGAHAHKECQQFLICVKGSVSVMVDDGNARAEVVLDSPDLGVYIPPLVWGTQYRYTEDAVLLVFASHPYDDADYIRDYQTFQAITKK